MHPLTDREEVREKFRALSEPLLGARRAGETRAAVLGSRSSPQHCEDLVQMIAAPAKSTVQRPWPAR